MFDGRVHTCVSMIVVGVAVVVVVVGVPTSLAGFGIMGIGFGREHRCHRCNLPWRRRCLHALAGRHARGS